MDVSIVIPTKNGGALFDEVLTMIDKQETEYEYEVICVDSGSTDDTVDIIKRHHCILKQIDKTEFGHGKTRNLGASLELVSILSLLHKMLYLMIHTGFKILLMV